MKLKRKYSKQSDVPSYATFMYEEVDGSYVPREGVDIEALEAAFGGNEDREPGDDRDEFRRRNRALQTQLDTTRSELGTIRKQFEGVDADDFRKFQVELGKVAEEEERKLIASGQIDEVVKRRTGRILDERNAELKTRTDAFNDLTTKYEALAGNHATMRAQNQMARLLSEKGLRVRKGAQTELDRLIAADWTVAEDGKRLKPRREDMRGDDGGPMSETYYVEKELLGRCGFYFESAKGGGAQGGVDEQQQKGVTVARTPLDMGRSLEAIAKGEVTVEE